MAFLAATGVFTPDEFDVVNRVYHDISSEEWFTHSEERREQFAALVIDLYRQGVQDPQNLALRCRSLALVSFGNGGFSH